MLQLISVIKQTFSVNIVIAVNETQFPINAYIRRKPPLLIQSSGKGSVNKFRMKWNKYY